MPEFHPDHADRPEVALADHTGRNISVNIFMPTTVHIPDPLLKSVDRRAEARDISRNRLVVRALAQAVSLRSAWARVSGKEPHDL
jgi:hypothetical protein